MPRAFTASFVTLLAFAAIIVWAIVASRRLAGLISPPGIGVPVDAGDQTVVVETVEQWLGRTDWPALDGDVYVTVELAITPEDNAVVDTLDTHVLASDGSSYDPAFFGAREPSLPEGQLTPGVRVEGWMTFQVPIGLAGHLTLIYATSFANLHSPPVPIPLY